MHSFCLVNDRITLDLFLGNLQNKVYTAKNTTESAGLFFYKSLSQAEKIISDAQIGEIGH